MLVWFLAGSYGPVGLDEDAGACPHGPARNSSSGWRPAGPSTHHVGERRVVGHAAVQGVALDLRPRPRPHRRPGLRFISREPFDSGRSRYDRPLGYDASPCAARVRDFLAESGDAGPGIVIEGSTKS